MPDMRRRLAWAFLFSNLLLCPEGRADSRCPLAHLPPTPVLEPDLPRLKAALESLREPDPLVRISPQDERSLSEIFVSMKSKLGQFFELLYWIQREVGPERLPIRVEPPGIGEVLLAARVFPDASFPGRIRATTLGRDDRNRPPVYRVSFDAAEVRFPVNGGIGFAVWEQGMCQIAKELIFSDPFSFRLRRARNSQNLVVDDLQGVQLYGRFGTRKIFSVDLNYVDVEKIEFIRGTDEGRVTSRVSRRELALNRHSFLFRFIGTLIPNTSRQRIDW